MSNKPIGYRNTKLSPDVPGKTSSRSEKLAELKEGAESRSKRVQILIAPSVYEKLKRISKETGASVNEIINKSIGKYIKDL